MNERIEKLAFEAGLKWKAQPPHYTNTNNPIDFPVSANRDLEKFAELIVKEMCGLMEQAEDDAYHCFEPSERPTEYIGWLRDWQERFEKHFGVEE